MKTLILSLLMLFAIQGYSQTATLTARTMTPLALVNDSWKTGTDTECDLTAELGTDYVKVYSSTNEIILNTRIDLIEVVENYDNSTYVFSVPNEETALIQYLIYKDKNNPVIGLLWVSSRSSGKGVILELRLKEKSQIRYIKGE